MTSEYEDRRAKKRFNLAQAEYTDVCRREECVSISIKDISESGVRFWAQKEIPRDTLVMLNVNFFPVTFPIRSVIIWARSAEEDGFEHGAEFVNLPPEERALICTYLRELKE